MAVSPPTMKDVARLAEVSPMTVSRFLSGTGTVSEARAKRISAAISELGYVPDLIAGSLSSRKTGFVAAIVPSLSNANFADSARGMTEVLSAAGYQVLIGATDYSIDTEEKIVRSMIGRRPEGVVITGGHHSDTTITMLRREQIPVVEIWDLPDQPIGMTVGFSNYEVGRAMTEHLIDLGYRRIAFIGPSANHSHRDYRGEARTHGFRAAMADAGLPDHLVADALEPPISFREGAQAAAEIIARFGEVDAIFAVSDLAAVGALMECRRRGIRVPDDIGIAGFGNFELSAVIEPALTTVRVNATDIGRVAGRAIIDALQGEPGQPAPGTVHNLGFEILNRRSTRRRPA